MNDEEMTMTFSVYCSGSIVKGSSDEKKLCWSEAERRDVLTGAAAKIVFLNPDDPITDPRNTLGQFGRDMYQVMTATAVIVDARERRGLGIGVEMAAAATFGTPIIFVAPRNSKYRSDQLEYRDAVIRDYVHPHAASLATVVVDDFVSAGQALLKVAESRPGIRRPVPSWLQAAISEYETNVLEGDSPMLEALNELNNK